MMCSHSKAKCEALWLVRERGTRESSIERAWVQILLEPLQNFGNYVYPTLPISFARDAKRRWSGEVKYPIQGVNLQPVVDSTTPREG